MKSNIFPNIKYVFFAILSMLVAIVQAQKNVLFISIDDLRPELNCYGSSYMVTPNIDALAQEGMLFTNAYSQQAICTPSRISMLTGLRPATTGLYNLSDQLTKHDPDIISMPKAFKNAGYKTESIGKLYHHVNDDADAWIETVRYGNGDIGKSDRPSTFIVANNLEQECRDYKHASTAIAKLEQHKNDPFFIAVGFLKPHLPFVAPQKYWDMYPANEVTVPAKTPPEGADNNMTTQDWQELRNQYDGYENIPSRGTLPDNEAIKLIRGYRASVSFIDAQVGRVIKKLEDLGLREQTIIVLWSDHGWKLGDYGDWCKHTNFELDTRIPLIIDLPGIEGGQKSSALVESVDLFPTLAEYANVPAPANLDGMSMIPIIENPDSPWKVAAFSQYPRWNGIMGTTVRTTDYRYTEYLSADGQLKTNTTELYAHTNDTPLEKETENLFPNNNGSQHQQTVDSMRALIALGWDKIKVQAEEAQKKKNEEDEEVVLTSKNAIESKLLIKNSLDEHYVIFSKEKISSIRVFNMTGTLVESSTNLRSETVSLDTSQLPKGMLIVIINGKFSSKIINN